MKRKRMLTSVIEREGDGYVSLCPELNIASQGKTVEEARRNLVEALELFFETASKAEVRERLHSEVYVTPIEVAVG
jgi:predicted RNase H-like HicB family nuclease